MDQTPAASATGPSVGTGVPVVIAATGKTGEVWPLAIKIFFLNLVTATIYRFWGTTQVRRYIWSRTTINGEPLEYLGKGSELLIGFIVVFLFILAPLGGAFYAAQTLFAPNSPQFLASIALFYLVFFFLIGIAIYRALRYRLTRTAWRGIRFGLEGSAVGFATKFLGLLLLNIALLGWLTPVLDNFVMRRLSNDARFGQTPFHFDGKAGRLYGPFALTFVLTLVGYIALVIALMPIFSAIFSGLTPEDAQSPDFVLKLIPLYLIVFGAAMVLSLLIGTIYSAARMHAFAEGLRFENLAFTTNISYWGLVGLALTNMLLVTFTLGIGIPVAHMRSFKYVLGNLKAHGTLDLGAIAQSKKGAPRFGEGLADAFDIGGI